MPHPDLDAATRDWLQRAIARKAGELNLVLTAALARQNTTLATVKLPHERKPGETPLERLRRFFDLVVGLQRRSTTDALGLCVTCEAPIPRAMLVETPWQHLCGPCQEREVAEAIAAGILPPDPGPPPEG